ncbi:hypothetical protein OIU78_024321 [Salix suchowensis]|nr:hypothetical protein OIU78_024321 [Salix suchowensis]
MNEPKTITTPDRAEQRRTQISNSLDQFQKLDSKRSNISLPCWLFKIWGHPNTTKIK